MDLPILNQNIIPFLQSQLLTPQMLMIKCHHLIIVIMIFGGFSCFPASSFFNVDYKSPAKRRQKKQLSNAGSRSKPWNLSFKVHFDVALPPSASVTMVPRGSFPIPRISLIDFHIQNGIFKEDLKIDDMANEGKAQGKILRKRIFWRKKGG